jgi:hypothetical protein
MRTLLEQLLFTEADSTDTDSADNTKDTNDIDKDNKDISKDDTNDNPPPDDTTDTTTDTAVDTPEDSSPDTDTTDDGEPAPTDGDLDSSVASTLDNVDWEKKLFITTEFETIHTTYNNLEKFVSSAILQINYSNNVERLLRSILDKINYNLISLNEILEGNLLIDLEYKSLEKLLEIYSKDIENITSTIKLIANDTEVKGKTEKK